MRNKRFYLFSVMVCLTLALSLSIAKADDQTQKKEMPEIVAALSASEATSLNKEEMDALRGGWTVPATIQVQLATGKTVLYFPDLGFYWTGSKVVVGDPRPVTVSNVSTSNSWNYYDYGTSVSQPASSSNTTTTTTTATTTPTTNSGVSSVMTYQKQILNVTTSSTSGSGGMYTIY